MVFDPNLDGSDLTTCWRFPPFGNQQYITPQSAADIIADMEPKYNKYGQKLANWNDVAVNEWHRKPFNAHSVARGRPLAYKKRIVMKYIEILIAAGDEQFRQSTLEAMPLAIQRYVEASHLFGPPLQPMPKLGKRPVKTYNDIVGGLTKCSNAYLEMELDFPFSCLAKDVATGNLDKDSTRTGLLGFVKSAYFCVPTNPQLLALRDLIDDRLFKIRNGLDINGNAVSYKLFEPPIDPGMLMAQMAAGQGSGFLLADMDAPMSNCRFTYLLQKSLELVSELRSMADFFLSAREKRDTEAFSQLKARQDIALQTLVMDIKQLQKDEVIQAIEVLQEQRKSHVMRLKFYQDLVGDKTSPPTEDGPWTDLQQDIGEPTQDDLRMSPNEKIEMDKANDAGNLTFATSILETTASVLYGLPNVVTHASPLGVGPGIKFGPENIARSISGATTVMKLTAQYWEMQSSRAGRKAQMIRQLQERRLQANLAGREISSVDKQIAGHRLRVKSCLAEIKSQSLAMQHAKETDSWYKTKYSNETLYAWMENSSRKLLYDLYTLTIGLAKKAEKALEFEYGLPKPGRFLSPTGYWNDSRDGLLAAQHLHIALKKMEVAYLEENPANFEISKSISLRQINPLALLNLRSTGQTTFSLQEVLFGLDFPGHYFRRIKSLFITIPCITGRHVSTNCTLTLLNHKYRVNPSLPNGKYLESDSDERFRSEKIPITSVAISAGQPGSGRFELDFRGERFMPFENAGAISEWKLEFPSQFRQFDYDTISDVIINTGYTARQGGTRLKEVANTAVSQYVGAAARLSRNKGLFALFDLKNEFPDACFALTSSSASPKSLRLKDLRERLPFWTRGSDVYVTNSTIFVRSAKAKSHTKASQGGVAAVTKAHPKAFNGEISFGPEAQPYKMLTGALNSPSWTLYATPDGKEDGLDTDWTFSVAEAAGTKLDTFDNVFVVLRYGIKLGNRSAPEN